MNIHKNRCFRNTYLSNFMVFFFFIYSTKLYLAPIVCQRWFCKTKIVQTDENVTHNFKWISGGISLIINNLSLGKEKNMKWLERRVIVTSTLQIKQCMEETWINHDRMQEDELGSCEKVTKTWNQTGMEDDEVCRTW